MQLAVGSHSLEASAHTYLTCFSFIDWTGWGGLGLCAAMIIRRNENTCGSEDEKKWPEHWVVDSCGVWPSHVIILFGFLLVTYSTEKSLFYSSISHLGSMWKHQKKPQIGAPVCSRSSETWFAHISAPPFGLAKYSYTNFLCRSSLGT